MPAPSIDERNRRMAAILGRGTNFIDKHNGAYTKQLIASYRAALKNIRTQISEVFAKHGDKVSIGELQKYNRLANLEASILAELKDLGVSSKSIIDKSLKDTFKRQYGYVGYAAESSFAINTGFGGLSPDTINAALLNPLDRIKWPKRMQGHVNVLNDRIRMTMGTGFAQGFGFSKMAQELKDKIERTLGDTERILRTEGLRVRSVATNIGFEKVKAAGDRLGYELEEIWDATLDGRTRSSHRAIDGKAADKNGEWTFPSGVKTRGPGLSGVAEEDIDCRCGKRMQLKGNGPRFRRDVLNRETIEYETFEEWAKRKGLKFSGEEF